MFPRAGQFRQEGKTAIELASYMLPYLEGNALYKQFHLDEPWDSEHNRKLIPLMPQEFRNPYGTAEPGKTQYLAVCGKGLMFEGNKGRKLAEITDGRRTRSPWSKSTTTRPSPGPSRTTGSMTPSVRWPAWAGPIPPVSVRHLPTARSVSSRAQLIPRFFTRC